MPENKTKRNPNDYINVSVLRINHESIKKHLESKKTGEDIGKFYDLAAIEKMQKEKSKTK